MLMLLSFPSFFSSFVGQWYHLWIVPLTAYERNEKDEVRCSWARGFFPLISSHSFISFPVIFCDADNILPICSGAISNSQPTRCGHTLRGVHCRGWRVAAPLRTLQRQKS